VTNDQLFNFIVGIQVCTILGTLALWFLVVVLKYIWDLLSDNF
jgi:hypothetical protein